MATATPPTRKTMKSFVWKYFNIMDEDISKAMCTICGNVLSRGGRGLNCKNFNTTNLKKHLESKHKDEMNYHRSIIKEEIKPVTETFSSDFDDITMYAAFEMKKIMDNAGSSKEKINELIGGVGVAGSSSSAMDGAYSETDAGNSMQPFTASTDVDRGTKRSLESSTDNSGASKRQSVATLSGVSPNMTKKPVNKESYQLRHNNHLNLVLNQLAEDEDFMDVTLTAEGRPLKAHKSVLSAVSPYFSSVLRANPCQHPIIIMPSEIGFSELKNVITYIYRGQLTVPYEDIEKLLKAAELLQVVGLTSGDADKSDLNNTPLPDRQPASATNKRPLLSNVSDFLHSSSNDVDDLNPSDFLHKSVDRPKDADGADKLANPEVHAVDDWNQVVIKDETVNDLADTAIKVEATDTPTEVTTFDGLMASDDEDEEDPDALPSPGVCPHCQLFFPRDSMTQHLATQHPCIISYPCTTCHRIFKFVNAKNEHITNCSGS